MALMAAITRFCHLITGFDNHTLVQLMRSLPTRTTPAGRPPTTCAGSAKQII